MESRVLITVTALLLLLPRMSLSSYLITLKSGATFVTNEYWEEDNQIKFYAYGGVMGIEKSRVGRISESALPAYQPTLRQSAPNLKTGHTPAQRIDEKPKEKSDQKFDIEQYKMRKATLTKALRIAEKELIAASLSGDASAREKTTQQFFELHRQLFDLEKLYMENNNGTLPGF